MTHVVFGTGAVGMAVMEALVWRGEPVRMVNRGGGAEVPELVEVLGGDAADPEFTRRASAGAAVVYQALNPEYHRWAALFPALQAGVPAGAEAVGAKLVAMENVYGYGRAAGRPFTEDRPFRGPYQFDEPFIVDSSKFERAFGMSATPAAEAVAQTVERYRLRGVS